jgi:hypothetical protein
VDHSSDEHGDIIMPITTKKHSSDGPMTSPCPSLLCFYYMNELCKSLKMNLNGFKNINPFSEINGFKNIYYPLD